MSAWTYRQSDSKAASKIVPPRLRIPCWKGLGADSGEKREPASDIDTVVVDSLKALDPKWPIREADIPAFVYFRQPDASNQLALRRPYRHAAVTDGTAGVARGPDISVDIAAHAVGTAFHPVNHTIGEELLVGHLVVWTDIKHVDLTLTAWTSVAWSFARADDIEFLLVGRQQNPVRIRDLLFGDNDVEFAARIPAINIGRQLPFCRGKSRRLTEPRIELAAWVCRSARRIGLTLIQLTSIGRVGEPDAAVRMRNGIVRRIQALAVVRIQRSPLPSRQARNALRGE